jgi:pimeloyl-ACP methyl ester carboxylesterase
MIDETSNTLKSPTHKIEVLAAGIDFLTQQLPESKIILVGLSQGAAFSSEVMKLLSDNPQAYSIEAGIPFYTEPFQSERNFVINCNGITPDALSEGNFGGLAQAYLSAPFKWLSSKIQGKEIKRPGDYIQIPGHDYRLDQPEVSSQITEFLTDNFYPE